MNSLARVPGAHVPSIGRRPAGSRFLRTALISRRKRCPTARAPGRGRGGSWPALSTSTRPPPPCATAARRPPLLRRSSCRPPLPSPRPPRPAISPWTWAGISLSSRRWAGRPSLPLRRGRSRRLRATCHSCRSAASGDCPAPPSPPPPREVTLAQPNPSNRHPQRECARQCARPPVCLLVACPPGTSGSPPN